MSFTKLKYNKGHLLQTFWFVLVLLAFCSWYDEFVSPHHHSISKCQVSSCHGTHDENSTNDLDHVDPFDKFENKWEIIKIILLYKII